MAVALKTMTTHRLVLLLVIFLFGNSSHLLPADPASSAGWTIDDLYLPVVLLSASLLLTTAAATTILLYVRMAKPDKVSPAGWNKARALLLLAIGLSAVSTFLAVITFEFGFRYRRGHASVFFGLPAWVLMLFILGIEHGLDTGLLLAESQD